MFLRIPRDTSTKMGGCCISQFLVQKFSMVHSDYLLKQLRGVFMSVGLRNKPGFGLDGITLQHQHIVNSQELQVDQGILRLFPGEPSANDVGYRVYFIAVLNSRTDPYRPGSLSRGGFFQKPVFLFLIDVFLAMVRYVNKRRLELHQRVDVVKENLDILTL